MTTLQAEGLSYSFPGGVRALDGLDLMITRGRKLAILGRNGAGKSTLLLHLNGTLRPSAGRLLIDGQPADYSRAGLNAWRQRVGLVLQDADDQLFAASVFEDVSFGPLNLGLSDEETERRVVEALAALDLTDLADRPTHMLSGGQKKRAAIAGAMAMRPDVLLLDEPMAGLDQPVAEQLEAQLQQLATAGTTLVFSTHDVDLAHRLADDIALFAEGRVVANGPAGSLLTDEAALARVGLRPPLLLRAWSKARDNGWLAEDASPTTTLDALFEAMARHRRG